MEPLKVFQGDDKPSINVRIKDQDSGEYVDLSPSTTVIYAKFRARGTTTVLETLTGTKLFSGCRGHVRFDWSSDTLDVTDGRYEMEIYIDYNGSIQTVGVYYWSDTTYDKSSTLPIKVLEDF